MVCLVRHVLTDAPIGVHRTALDDEGRKTTIDGKSRAALGPVANGTIKLFPASRDLAVGEGLETALSIRALPRFADAPTWALISAGGLAKLPVLPGVERLIVAVDHDPAGAAAARETIRRWRAAGRAVVALCSSTPRADLNNEVRAHGA